MIVQWVIATTVLVGFALGLTKVIHQSIRELSWHREGLRQVTQSLVQRPRRSARIRLNIWNKGRSYEYKGRKIHLRFNSHYRK